MVKKLSNDSLGFTAVELVLVFVVVIFIGLVGWLVHKNHHKSTAVAITTTSYAKPTISTSSNKPAISASTKTATTTTPATAAISATTVTDLLTNFYNQYIACLSTGDLNRTCTTNLVNQNGTSNLYAYYMPAAGYTYPADPIVCGQDTPSSISVSGVTTTSTSASGVVTEVFNPPDTIKFTAVNQSGSLKIDTVTCNPPLVAQPGNGN